MRSPVRHNPLNDLVVDSAEIISQSEQLIQVILLRIELRQDKPLHKSEDKSQPAMTHRVEHRDVQDEAQD